ncbi:hypothetical protein MNBD_PLANCTO02-744, partial [hydrothermal vent metagenome]
MFHPLSENLLATQNAAQQGYQRQRNMGIGDLLLENRIIFMDGVINDG